MAVGIRFARGIVKSYNDALVQLMNNQYVYSDEVKKLWGKEFFVFNTGLPERYDSLFRYVQVVDPAVHAMNWMGIKLQAMKDDSNYVFRPEEKAALEKELGVLKDKINHLDSLTEWMIEGLE